MNSYKFDPDMKADVRRKRQAHHAAKYQAAVAREEQRAEKREAEIAKRSLIVREARLIKSIIPHPWGKLESREW